jgi:hypothetical protein
MAVAHPIVISPRIAQVASNGSCLGRHFTLEGKRVGLIDLITVIARDDVILVRNANVEVRHKSLQYPRSFPSTHAQLRFVPAGEFTHDENLLCIGSPYCEICPFHALHVDAVRSQLFIEVVVSSLVK